MDDAIELTAIEILSPHQAYDVLARKIRKVYFPAGVLSGRIVMPSVKAIQLFLPNMPVSYTNAGTFRDSATKIKLDLTQIFR